MKLHGYFSTFCRLWANSFSIQKKSSSDQRVKMNPAGNMYRRKIIKGLATFPLVGPYLLSGKGLSFEEKNLIGRLSNSEVRINIPGDTGMPKSEMKIPMANLGKESISRMILGGNLMGGWAHARDLLYVSKLVTTYFTDEKIFETFALAERFGINAFLTNPILIRVINEYWKKDLGKIKFISDCGAENLFDGIRISIDNGASACYIHGGIADNLVEKGKVEDIAKGLELIRRNGLPAGIGGHKLETVKACVDYGLKPDFWMKTLHHTNYWSSEPVNQNDNIWCTNPEETIEFMRVIKQPWIAYKILAAGAIEPAKGFQYAFQHGADFICVGMFDFQLEEDVKLTLNVLNSDLKRERPWRA